jgi:enoyl-CoA hydratase/carnithine racemase
MHLTGEMISAATAADWGLINRTVPASALAAETRRLANGTADASPLTVATCKRAWCAEEPISQ